MDRAEFLATRYNRAQLVRFFGRIMPESEGFPCYGWDMPTLRMVYPGKVGWIEDILLAIDLKDKAAG